jgi:hypothetical protein
MNKLSLLLVVFLLFGCKNSQQKDEAKTVKRVSYSFFKSSFEGKKASSVDAVITDKGTDNCFIYIFSFYDCTNCVDAGFYYCKALDAAVGRHIAFPIATLTSPSYYQERTNYAEYVYYDKEDVLRKELKFIPTPTLLLLDKDRTIHSCFMPKDTVGMQQQIETLLSKWQQIAQ